ncbi:hypothetical protein INR49_020826 [Caranx melampygus]|nr:hypothetical protein INR49_020826 [Caranx melampygus]
MRWRGGVEGLKEMGEGRGRGRFKRTAVVMAEEEVNYASVVFKNKKKQQPQAEKEEEPVYSQVQNKTSKQSVNTKAEEEEPVYNKVKEQSQTSEQSADTNASLIPDKKGESRRHPCLLVASFLAILCVILIAGIIVVCISFLPLNQKTELEQLKDNQTALLEENHNLTEHNNRLSSENANLTQNYNDLIISSTSQSTVQIGFKRTAVVMAEEEVNYASVVFKNKKKQQPQAEKEEEPVYSQVQKKTSKQSVNTKASLIPDKKGESRRHPCLLVASFLAILCVILIAGIIVVCISFLPPNQKTELEQLKDNQTALLEGNHNLTEHNNRLSSENKDLTQNYSDLIIRFENLTEAYNVSELRELKTQSKNLTQQIQNKETELIQSNVSRAEWSINAYCPIDSSRQCKSCQAGWIHEKSSCYAFNDAKPPGQKTWTEAQEDCRGKGSDLVIIADETEKTYIRNNPYGNRLWIGLRVVDGKWKWVDGSYGGHSLLQVAAADWPPEGAVVALHSIFLGCAASFLSCHVKNNFVWSSTSQSTVQIGFKRTAVVMAEEEVNYASVVFKNKKKQQPQDEQEETVYSEVKVQNKTSKQSDKTNAEKEEEPVYSQVQKKTSKQSVNTKASLIPDKKGESRRHPCLLVASFLAILCVILIAGIIVVCISFLPLNQKTELEQLKFNQTALLEGNHNLTEHNNRLSSENQNLTQNYSDLIIRFENLTEAYNLSELRSSLKLTGELDAVFRMRRNTQQPTVTFQNPHVSPSAEDYEEVDHVNAAVISENNLPAILDEKRRSLTQALPTIAVSWLILSVILALDIYFTSVISDNNTKLTEENMQLNEKNQELNEKIQNLTTENQELNDKNQELKTQSNILKQQIQDKETELIQFNVSRAQWIINAYCPIDNRRQCRPCQTGWTHEKSSCYAFNNYPPPEQKTWTEAQEHCRGKGSDLVVIADETEKKLTGELDAVFRMRRNTQQPTVTFQNPHVSPSAEDYEEVDHVNAAVISENNLPAILDEKRRSLTQALPTIAVSWLILSRAVTEASFGSSGFWIGLRVVDGKWKWVDGSELKKELWTEPPNDGQCAVLFKNHGWTSVSCGERNQWICELAALSKLTGELDAVFRMRRNTQQPTVTFQNPHVSPSAEDDEEVDHVNAAVISENNLPAILDEKRRSLTQALPTIAVSWVILCVILALDIYFTSVISDNNTKLTEENMQLISDNEKLLEKLKFNQTALLEENHNLTEHNNRLSSENKDLTQNYNDLIIRFENLTEAYNLSELRVTTMTVENQELNEKIQELKTQSNILKQQIQDKESELIQFNVSRAEWIINAYCPIDSRRQCRPCQAGWRHEKSSCYAFNDYPPPGQKPGQKLKKTAEERIGLRVVDGKWKWVDGSELKKELWTEPPNDGQCAVLFKNQRWRSVSCGRQCRPCQTGWRHEKSSCYAFNDYPPPEQKTWTEAQEDCRGKGSDLVVIADEREKVMGDTAC